ncbi:MAG: hypothetical protein QXF12_03400, partial [Candidatus Aenigmatarchaeota archaeon]
MFGKSQSSLLIIVSIVSITAILWLVSMYNQTSYTKQSLKDFMLSKMQQYIASFKGFTRNALTLSVHQSAKNIASKGGSDMGIERTWICTNPTPPKVDEVRYYISEDTKKLLNSYMIKANKSKEDEGIQFFVGKFNCIDYDVSDSSVMSKKNEESFNVGAYGSYLYASDGSVFLNSTNNVYEEMGRVRFWYVYRNFREWAESNVFYGYMCDCMSKICNCDQSGDCMSSCPSFYQCYQNAVNLALENLQNRFDEYVSCEADYGCCYQEKQSCGDIRGCIPWMESPECNNCYYGNPQGLCINNELKFSESSEAYPRLNTSSARITYSPVTAQNLDDECSDKVVEMWNTVKGSVDAKFRCTDKKYRLSVLGDNYLKFGVHAKISIQSRRCYSNDGCECEWSCDTGIFDEVEGLCLDPITRVPLPIQPDCDRCVPKNLQQHWCTQCKTPSLNVEQDPPSNADFKIETPQNIPWNHKTYSGNFQQIFDQIRSEMGLNVNLYDDCVGIIDGYWCWVNAKGCNGFGIYC